MSLSAITKPDSALIRLDGVAKHYHSRAGDLTAVHPTSLEVYSGEVYGLIGYSGAGKSTLLRLVNLLEQPSAGKIVVDGQELTALDAKGLRRARQHIGMIFQHYNLLHNRTVAQNVEFPLDVAGVPKRKWAARVAECLEIVGLADKAQHYPSQLSGGQRQRVAIARALANQPKVLLCDEPTSALDPQTTSTVLDYLAAINRDLGVTILLVTHEMEVARRLCHRVGVMEHGHLVEELDPRSPRQPSSEIGRHLLAA